MKVRRHPDDEALLALCGFGDSGAGDAFASEHLKSGCATCSAKLRGYKQVLLALRSAPLQAAPGPWVDAAMERIRELAAGREGTSAEPREQGIADRIRRLGEEIRMGLALDSRFGAAMPGIRSVGSMTPRQLLFECPGASLHVQILESGEGTIDLLGQILIEEESGRTPPLEIHLVSGDKTWKRDLSQLGEFRVDGVPSGPLRIRIPWNEECLVVDLLESE